MSALEPDDDLVPIEYIYSNKKKPLIAVMGYEFREYSAKNTGSSYWRCTEERTPACPAKLITSKLSPPQAISARLAVSNHNHEPRFAKLEKRRRLSVVRAVQQEPLNESNDFSYQLFGSKINILLKSSFSSSNRIYLFGISENLKFFEKATFWFIDDQVGLSPNGYETILFFGQISGRSILMFVALVSDKQSDTLELLFLAIKQLGLTPPTVICPPVITPGLDAICPTSRHFEGNFVHFSSIVYDTAVANRTPLRSGEANEIFYTEYFKVKALAFVPKEDAAICWETQLKGKMISLSEDFEKVFEEEILPQMERWSYFHALRAGAAVNQSDIEEVKNFITQLIGSEENSQSVLLFSSSVAILLQEATINLNVSSKHARKNIETCLVATVNSYDKDKARTYIEQVAEILRNLAFQQKGRNKLSKEEQRKAFLEQMSLEIQPEQDPLESEIFERALNEVMPE